MLFNLYTYFFITLLLFFSSVSLLLKGSLGVNLIYSLSNSFNLSLTFLPINNIFFIIFFIITLSAFLYSQFYISTASTTLRFFFINASFVISIICLIIGKSPLIIFLGWDGLGISSFCLILYFLNLNSQNSGLVTIMTNRFGDSLFLTFLVFLFSQNFSSFNPLSLPIFFCWIFCILVLTNSAQYPFTSWLPLAIAAPTPISALVHSSTLVAAGIFLLISNAFFLDSPPFLWAIFILASITALLSGLNSLVESDVNKIIALSTLNQLSFIFLTASLNFISLAFFHLLSHAIFNSLLFFNGGVILHFWINSQEYRNFNSILNFSWFLQLSIFVSLINLIGITFFSGFFSKDMILETFEQTWSSVFIFFFYLLFFFTFFYCLRFFFITLLSHSNNITTFIPQNEVIWVTPIFFITALSITWGDFFFNFLFYNISPINNWNLVIFFIIFISLLFFNWYPPQPHSLSFISSILFVSNLLETSNNTNSALEVLNFHLETGGMSSFLSELNTWTLTPLFSFLNPSLIIFIYLSLCISLCLLYFWFNVLNILYPSHNFLINW